ncbi:hypothetical protein HNY73_006590 [Argiope bruennichi]|uniref:Uncharacterized protein n=1 Tax=Argiope bruennichi TaxID=94029 RepID=A0A8T0FE11_ARGBR|nr:hypothetical protein HNY73_006590 [Argiope bruennichi]
MLFKMVASKSQSGSTEEAHDPEIGYLAVLSAGENLEPTLQDLRVGSSGDNVLSGDNPADLISRGGKSVQNARESLVVGRPCLFKKHEYPCREISDSVIRDV